MPSNPIFSMLDQVGGISGAPSVATPSAATPGAFSHPQQFDPMTGFQFGDFNSWLSNYGYSSGDMPWLKAGGQLGGLMSAYEQAKNEAAAKWASVHDPNAARARQLQYMQLNSASPYMSPVRQPGQYQ